MNQIKTLLDYVYCKKYRKWRDGQTKLQYLNILTNLNMVYSLTAA